GGERGHHQNGSFGDLPVSRGGVGCAGVMTGRGRGRGGRLTVRGSGRSGASAGSAFTAGRASTVGGSSAGGEGGATAGAGGRAGVETVSSVELPRVASTTITPAAIATSATPMPIASFVPRGGAAEGCEISRIDCRACSIAGDDW